MKHGTCEMIPPIDAGIIVDRIYDTLTMVYSVEYELAGIARGTVYIKSELKYSSRYQRRCDDSPERHGVHISSSSRRNGGQRGARHPE